MARSSSREGPASPPSALGYQLPAEWEPHDGTCLSWPHNPATWPGNLPEVEDFYAHLAAAIARDETVYLNVNGDAGEARARQVLDDHHVRGDIRFWRIPTNDAWCRDYGPTIVRRSGAASAYPPRLAIKWEYNAWGGKYPPWDADNAAAPRMAAELGFPCISAGIVAEGGALEGNGAGWLMTTESCLLSPLRNPHRTRDELEVVLRSMLGVEEILWLGGDLCGDDTDGHIDNLVRFVGPRTVVAIWEANRDDENFEGLDRNLHRLKAWRSRTGETLQVVPLPMPDPVRSGNMRLPASYGNFYLTNRSVLIPQYQCPQDGLAREVLSGCFPDRDVVGVDCTYAIRGLGAIHCLTQQVPSA